MKPGIGVRLFGRNGRSANVSDEGQLEVVVHPHPPRDEDADGQPVPFRQYFTDDGSATGSNNMIVDGSSTAVDFYIKAIPEYDIYIKSITLEIGDSGSPNLNLFGALPALSNGVQWIWTTQGDGAYELHDGIKTNKEFVRLGVDTAGIGTGTDAYLADVSGGGSTKSYLPIIDIAETFGMPWGVRLKKGTTDNLCFKIRDAMAGLDVFNAIGHGIRF